MLTREELEGLSHQSFYEIQEPEINKLIVMARMALEAEEMAKFYADESKWFQKEHETNLQETTAVFHVEDPTRLPTSFKSKSWEATARIKADHGTVAREWLKKFEEMKR